ncbi:MAG: multicomponent Na+:H+ antiporter subunit B [Candidatus Omnitrophota bacterium]|jgi:multicomponent Na+:H+ antiporter subunit B
MIVFIDIVLLTLLVVTAITLVYLKNLIATVMLAGIFSLLSACIFMTMDAVDVAFTEAAVGAGVTTVLMLGALVLIRKEEVPAKKSSPLPFLVVLITGFVLIYGTLDMPYFGSHDAPIHHHVADRYLEESGGHHGEVGPPNVVTSVLASYRGYDTMGEVAVIFTAAVSVMMLLGVGFAAKREDKS